MNNFDLLISKRDFDEFKTLSVNTSEDTELDPFIMEAQDIDLRPLMGQRLYYDLLKNPTNANNVKLLEGVEYTFQDAPIFMKGIKPVLVYFSYARYVSQRNAKDTPFGLVTKNNPNSTPLDPKEITRIINQARGAAVAYWDEVVVYLNLNATEFPLWRMNTRSRTASGFKFNAIGGNSKYNRNKGNTQNHINGDDCCD